MSSEIKSGGYPAQRYPRPAPTLPNPNVPLPGRVPSWLAILEGVTLAVGFLLWAYACLNIS